MNMHMHTPDSTTCRRCGARLPPANWRAKLCPACLLSDPLNLAPNHRIRVVFGGFFLIAGLTVATCGVMMMSWAGFPKSVEFPSGPIPAIVVGLVFAGLGVGALRSAISIRLDLAAKTYRIRLGVFPFARTEVGTFAEFDRLEFTHGRYSASVYRIGSPSISRVSEDPDQEFWRVELVLKDLRRLVLVERGPGRIADIGSDYGRETRDLGEELAARLGLQLTEPAPEESEESEESV